MPRVLVHEYFSGGAATHDADLLAQGRAMRDAMCADLEALPGVQAICVTNDELPRLAARADAVWSVAPETGGVLLSICESIAPSKWLGCSAAAIRIAASKQATRERLGAAGIDVPETGDDGRFVVKPDDGAGALDTVVFDSLAAARAHWTTLRACALRDERFGAAVRAHARDGMTIERWIDGAPMSASLLCASGRAELLALNRQRVEVARDGKVEYRGVEIDVEPIDGERGRRVQRLASRIAAALPGLFGWVGIDFVWHRERGPVVIEVNPRVTSAYVGLSARLQRNVAAELLARWRDG